MITMSLSAWNLAQPTALVREIEASFLANTAANLSSNPYLSSASQREIGGLIGSGGSPRQVGDALYMAYARDWAQDLRAHWGEEAVRISWHGAERFARPLRTVSIAETRRHEGPGDVLEVSLPGEYVANDASDALTGGMGLMLMGLEAQPYYFLKYPTRKCGRVYFRFARPSLMEEGLLRFFGERSARFCFGSDLVTPRQSLDLHKLGYQAMALPTKALQIHDWKSPPLGAAVHDAGHAAFWSSHVEPPLRLAASLMAESAEEVLTSGRKKKLEWGLSLIEDLNLRFLGGLFDGVRGWRKDLTPRQFARVVENFLEKWKCVPQEVGPHPDFPKIRRRAERLISPR